MRTGRSGDNLPGGYNPFERASALSLDIPNAVLTASADIMKEGAMPPDLAIGFAFENWLARDALAKKRSGSFFTPVEIAKKLLEKGLGPLLERQTKDSVLSLRIIDPACGPGVFLAQAFYMIEERAVALGHPPGIELKKEIFANCIFGIDRNPNAVAAAQLSLDSICQGAIAKLNCIDSLLGTLPFKEGFFDAVIGNPPWGQKAIQFSKSEKQNLKNRFSVAVGALDPFTMFTELAVRLVKRKGIVAFVLPDVLLLKNHQPTRDFLLENTAMQYIASIGKAFPGVNLDCILLAVEKCTPPSTNHLIEIEEKGGPLPPVEQDLFCRLDAHKFNIYMTREKFDLVSRLRERGTVGDLFSAHEGVHTGNARSELFVTQAGESNPSKKCSTTPTYLRPVLVAGKEVEASTISWAGTYLVTKKDHLKKGQYANLGKEEWYSAHKILIRRTGDKVIAAVDTTGLYASNNFFVMLPKTPFSLQALWGVSALLNSRLMTWFFRAVQPRTKKLFAELKICHLHRFPFPIAPLRGPTADRAKAMRQLERLGSLALAGRSTNLLEAAVEQIYELSDADRALIVGSESV